jgi:O-antigen ligase
VNFLLLVFLLAIAIWAAILLPKIRLAISCAMVVVSGTFFGPDFFAIQGPIQLSIDRLLFAVVTAVTALFVLRGDLKLPQLAIPDLLIIGMVVWYFFRAITAGEPPQGSNPVGSWLFYVCIPAVCYALVRVANPSADEIRTIISAMIAVGVYIAIIGFFEARGWYSLVFPRYITDPNVWEFLGRARGPMMNPSANGIVLTMSLSFAALRITQGTRLQVLFYGFLSLVILAGVYSTLTRGVWIGAVLAIVAMFWKSTPRWVKVLGLISTIVFGTFATMGLKDQLLNMKRDKNLSAEDAAKSIELRPLLAIVAFEMFKESPLVGHGFNVYLKTSQAYIQNPSYDMPLEQSNGYVQHNIFLSSLVDTGMIGLAFYASILLYLSRAAWRLGNNRRVDPIYQMVGLGFVGMMTGYFLGGMFQDVVVMPMIQLYLMLLAGMLISVYQRTHCVPIDDVSIRAAYIRTGDPTAPAMGRRATDPPFPAGTQVGGGAFRPST